jgi:hypothetical protein
VLAPVRPVERGSKSARPVTALLSRRPRTGVRALAVGARPGGGRDFPSSQRFRAILSEIQSSVDKPAPISVYLSCEVDDRAINMKIDEQQKAEKFREAATRRVRNVETTLRRVRSLSNPETYAYTDEEVERMFEHLQNVLDHTKESFQRPRNNQQFSL